MKTFCLIKQNFYKFMEPAWYYRINTLEELNEHCGEHMGQLMIKTFADPHYDDALKAGDVAAYVRHPRNLGPKRAEAMCKHMLKNGAVYINRAGGWMILTPTCEILSEVQANSFPELEKKMEGQFVYIHKWPLGNHYYLSGWPSTLVFSSEKFNTYEEAEAEAKRHVPADKVKFKEEAPGQFVYNREGD